MHLNFFLQCVEILPDPLITQQQTAYKLATLLMLLHAVQLVLQMQTVNFGSFSQTHTLSQYREDCASSNGT